MAFSESPMLLGECRCQASSAFPVRLTSQAALGISSLTKPHPRVSLSHPLRIRVFLQRGTNHWPRFTGCWGTAVSIVTCSRSLGSSDHSFSVSSASWGSLCLDTPCTALSLGTACPVGSRPGPAGILGELAGSVRAMQVAGETVGTGMGLQLRGGSPGVFSKCPGQRERGWLWWA